MTPIGKKTYKFNFRLNDEERAMIQSQADRKGLTPSSYIRSLVYREQEKSMKERLPHEK